MKDKRGRESFFNPKEDEDGDFFISIHERDYYLELSKEVKKKEFSWLIDKKEKPHKPRS